MLQISMEDVIKVVDSCKPYLIFGGIVLLLALAVIVVCRKLDMPKRKFVRAQAGIAILVAMVIMINMICFIPMETLISLATGEGTISEQTTEEATEVCENIAEEGIVLLKNEENLLPLNSEKKLNVFGWASINPCYGGTGSGSISDAYETVSLLQGLENAGIELNTEISDFYTNFRADRPEVGMRAQDWSLPEPTADSYSEELLSNAKKFSDTAMIVITRVGGEGADVPIDVSKVTYTDNTTAYKDFEEGEHYLQLSQTEKNMVDLVCSEFENVIVVYNGANAMELGFVNEHEQIKSALWCPGTGQSGFNALGKILTGEVNPSARTTDTFVADLTATPTWNNFGSFLYDNMSEYEARLEALNKDVTPGFVNYVENIYVGYKFYETAAEEGLIDYDKAVVYPFGHGLSYTDFSWEMEKIQTDGENISVSVTVKNTGNTAGKDVVELYYNPPYTNGGIEKASVNLLGFEKTKLLEPGESETVTMTFAPEDMASYDERGTGAYVLEQGNYEISVRKNSHTVVDKQVYTVDETITYDDSNPRATDKTVATNQFQDSEGDIIYLSRADGFANYEDAVKAPESMSMPEKYKEMFTCTDTFMRDVQNDDSDVMPVTGADNGMKLAELRGADYEDAKWDSLLDQLTIEEMDSLIALGGYQTSAVPSVGKVQTIDCDGPAAINNNFTRIGSIGFPAAVMIANTWNRNIALEFGESIGKIADDMNVSGWYAPAMNTHRSAFGGRNFEYYSEDGVLAGNMAANAIKGAEEYGIYSYIKHFALNDQETNRGEMLCTWSSEQAIREIYLKPFEIAVKEGGANAVMSAFNYIGTTWTGGMDALLNKVLRDEWGFQGFVITDRCGAPYSMNADQAIRNGGDCMLINYDMETNHVKDTESATSVKAMRRASKNILYTVVNSRAYSDENQKVHMPGWKIAAIVIDVFLAIIVIVLEFIAFKRYKKRKSTTIILETVSKE